MTTARKCLVTMMMCFTTTQRKARDTHEDGDDTGDKGQEVSGIDDGGDYDVEDDDVDDNEKLLSGIKTKLVTLSKTASVPTIKVRRRQFRRQRWPHLSRWN